MKEKLAYVRDNIAIISIAGYGLGLIYMSIFYYFFDVPIINYLSLNDILLFSITLILPSVLTLIAVEYLLREVKKIVYKKELNAIEERNFTFYCAIIIGIILMISTLFNSVRINPNLLFYFTFTPCVLIAKLISNLKGRNDTSVISVCFLGLLMGLYYIVNTGKAGLANKDVKFNYYNEIISTGFNKDLNYLGETSTTIFLHNFRKKITYVYEKSNISKLQYIDKIEKEFSPKELINFYAFNKAKYRTANDTVYKPFEWYKSNNRHYWWTAEKNPVGLSRLMWELNYVLDENGFDFENPTHSHSSLPATMNINDDYKETSEALNSGNCELHKKWETESGEIDLQLNKKYYTIQIKFKKIKK